MSTEKQFTAKHYVYLLIWWLSMGYALAHKTIWLGLLFILGFFFVSTFKVMGKLIIVMAAVFALTAIFPPLAAVIAALSVVFLLLRIKFLVQNWRALLVGIYTYFVYLAVVVFNGFFAKLIVIKIASLIAGLFQDNTVVEYGSTAFLIAAYLFPLILTIIFHRLLKWLYQHGYGTDRAFYVMGLTPLILIAVILPFLKINIEGHEIFHGSFSDGIGDVDPDISVNSHVLSSGVRSALEYANIDIGSMINVNTSVISPAIEASVASVAARGIFKVSSHLKDCTVHNENSTETVSYIDDTHAVIKDASGQRLGSITFDKNSGRETVELADGFTYTIEQETGNIIDAAGKLLGKIKDGGNGSKILVDGKDKVIRKFRSDGSIIDDNEHLIGTVTM